MSDCYTVVIVKRTRKLHQCDACRRVIAKGSKAFHQWGKCDGEFYSYYLCTICYELARDFPQYIIDDREGFIEPEILDEYMSYYECETPEEFLDKLKKGEIK